MTGLATNIDGNLVSTFQGTLPISFISHEVSLPAMNSNSSNEAYYDFQLPAGITVPMFYIAWEAGGTNSNCLYFFTHLGGQNWRVTFWGVGYIQPHIGWRPNWVEPLVKQGTKLIIGGYRG